MKSAFDSAPGEMSGVLFEPKEFDIYVNKITMEAYIFHAKPIERNIVRFEYDPTDHSITVVKSDGTRLDLGAKLQWLVRPYFTKAREIAVVQTKDGEALDGFMVPLFHKDTA